MFRARETVCVWNDIDLKRQLYGENCKHLGVSKAYIERTELV